MTPISHRPWLRRAWLCLAPISPWLLFGCSAAPHKPAFSLQGTNLVWPRPPDQPRIRYLGEITGEASLGRRPAGMEALRAVLEGPAASMAFATPVAVAVSGERLAIADPSHPGGPVLHLVDLQARTLTPVRMAGGAPLLWPIDVAASGQHLALADARRAAVFVMDLHGQTLATIGVGRLQRPAAVSWRAGGAELWVLDAAAHAVVVFDQAGAEVRRFGARGEALGEFNFPAGLCCLDSQVLGRPAPGLIGPVPARPAAVVADSMNFRVQLLDADGVALGAFGRKGDGAGDFSLPRDVAVDSAGHVYVLDNQFENFQIFEPDGRLLLALGEEGGRPGQFSLPSGITIDAADRIWIADTYNRRIQAFAYLPEDGS